MGMYDVENFAAIINPPEAAILAVGTAREIPVVENGQVRPAWRMKATISVDFLFPCRSKVRRRTNARHEKVRWCARMIT
jgi:hypothetical protein